MFLTHDPEDLVAYYGRALPRLEEIAEVRRNPRDRDLTTAELIEAAAGCEVIVAHRSTPGEAAVFEQLPDLLAFLRCAVDTSTIDVGAASANGVLVGRAAKSFVASTAELALGLLLAVARNIAISTVDYAAGRPPPQRSGWQLRGRTAGIIGFGSIGSYLAELLRSIGMDVLAHDPFIDQSLVDEVGPSGIDRPGIDGVGIDGVGVDRAGSDGAGIEGAGTEGAEVDEARVDGAGIDRPGIDGAGIDWPGIDEAGVRAASGDMVGGGGARRAGISFVGIDELLGRSDVVFPLAPGGPATDGLIGAAELARMRRGAVLVNVSRGELLDEGAVADALESGHLGGLAMDVGRAADQRPTPELAARPGVAATPHLGGLTPENADAQAMSSVEQIAAMLAGVLPPRALNAEHATRLRAFWERAGT